MLIALEQILHTNACQHYLTTDMSESLFDNGLLSIISVGFVRLVKMLITLELHGLFYYLYIFLKLAA